MVTLPAASSKEREALRPIRHRLGGEGRRGGGGDSHAIRVFLLKPSNSAPNLNNFPLTRRMCSRQKVQRGERGREGKGAVCVCERNCIWGKKEERGRGKFAEGKTRRRS